MTKTEIDRKITRVVSLLKKHQLATNGFNTSVSQPQNSNTNIWVEDMQNAFVPANILLPLTLLNLPEAKEIVAKEYLYLSQNRNTYGLWHYFNDKEAPFFIPYETDTNSILSYVSVYLNEKPLSKNYFYQQISKNGYFNLWFLPKSKFLFTTPFYFYSLLKNWNKAKNHLALKNNVVHKDDAEFCVSANVLLYLGSNQQTKNVVFKLLNDIRSSNQIKLIYYPFRIIAYYLFARAYFYGRIDVFEDVKQLLIEKLEIEYSNEIKNSKYLNILSANIFLFFNIKNSFSQKVIEECHRLYDQIEEPFPFYCSNKNTDINLATNLPNAYFGSKALTISFYLEFLVLLRSTDLIKEG